MILLSFVESELKLESELVAQVDKFVYSGRVWLW